MFCASDEHHFCDSGESSDDDDDGENSDRDREEIEAALYAQIHFHHEEEEGNLSYKGYSTSVQTLRSESTQIVRTTSTSTPSGSAPISLLSPPSTNNCVVSLSSEDESVYVVSDQDDVDLTDSECMILDEPLSDTGDIMVHVDSYQQPILQEAQVAHSEENDVCKISEMDQVVTTSNPGLKRYYNPISVRCHNCKEMGHISNVCPKPKKSEICHLCGMTGHFFRKCPEGICYNCEGPGHNSRDCPEQRKPRRQTCFRCLMPGHSKNTCPDIWRQFHVTTSVGPVQKREMTENPKRFCSNCASMKHFSYECEEDRMEWHEHGNYPFISTYTYKEQNFTRDKKSEKNPKPERKNPKPEKKNSKLQKKNSKPEKKNKKPKKKNPKPEKDINKGRRNWDNMAAIGAYKGTKRKYWEDAELDQHMERDQGKRRKKNNYKGSDNTQSQPKSWKKEKQENRYTDIRVSGEKEYYMSSGQGKHRPAQNKFKKGKEYVAKPGWQTYNPPHRRDKPNNFDRGFKTSYYQTQIPYHQNK